MCRSLTTPLSFFRRFGALLALLFTLAAPGWAAEHEIKDLAALRELCTETEDGSDYNLDKIGDDDVLNFTGDIELDKYLLIKKSVTLHGHGHKLTNQGNEDLRGSLIRIEGDNVDNSIQVTLDGLTLTHRNGRGMNIVDPRGSNVKVTLTNCAFAGNRASGQGGGLSVDNAKVTMANCTFAGNRAGDRGGGMYSSTGGTETLTNCTFVGNTANDGGAEVYKSGGTLNAVNTVFWNEGNGYILNDGTLNLYHCAYGAEAISRNSNNPVTPDGNCVTNLDWLGRVSEDVEVGGVTHKVFRPAAEDAALIDAGAASIEGNETLTNLIPANDQPGAARPFGKAPDIGAVEYVETVSIETTALPEATVGTEYTASISAKPAIADVTVTSTLPDWLTLTSKDKTITLTGTPTAVGTLDITVRAVCGAEVYSADKTLTLTVGKGTPKVTDLTATAITYGETLASSDITGTTTNARGEAVAGSFAWQSPDIIPAAGTQSFTAIFKPKDADNYNEVSADVSVVVGKAALTVTANNKTITYGDAPANNGESYSGFVNGETLSVLGGTLSYTYSYSQYGDVGSYTITPSGLTSGNYEITFATGTLTVEQKEVGLLWGDTNFTYNGQPQAPTATATGLVNNDAVGVTVTGAQTDAGTGYTATASKLTGDKAGNYKLPDAKNITFSIGRAGITPGVTITGWTYGGAPSTPSVTGNPGNGDVTYYYNTTNSNTGGTEWTNITGTTLNVGTYYLYATVAESTNYNAATTATAGFSIGKANATVTANNQTVTRNGEIQQGAAWATLFDAVSGHALSAVTLTANTSKVTDSGTITPSAAAIKDASGNDVTGNYAIGYTDGNLTVQWEDNARSTGTASAPVETVTPEGSRTETETVFTEPWEGGAIIASVDIAITTASAELTGTVSEDFSADVAVSVNINTAYKHKSYTLSLDVAGLPEWLKAEGEMLHKDVPLASKDFTLKLSGTPRLAGNAAVKFAAAVTVSGDLPVLVANADKTVTVTVERAKSVIESLTATAITYGQTLASSTLTGTATVHGTEIAGTFAWKDGTIQPAVADSGVTAYAVVFTPDEGDKYAPADGQVTLTVNKAASAVVTAPAPRTGLTYNTRAQELIEAGTASGGTMVYALNGGDFSAAIPTATEVGNYTVTYKVVGDANHNDTAAATLPVITIVPKTEEQKAVEEKAQEIINNLDETVAKSEAGQTMTDALQSGNPETQEAAVDVVKSLEKTGTDLSNLTAHDVEKAVENKKEETAAAKQEEENGGVVENTTVPAGTDLLARSDNEVLNNASENLSVSPKVVTPVAASLEEAKKTADNLNEMAEQAPGDSVNGVDKTLVQAAAANMNSSNDITIQPAPSNTDEQAKHLETLLVKVIEVLAKQSEVVASALPEITSWKSGFFQFDVNLRNLLPGQRPHFWPSSEHYKAAQGKATVAGVELAAGKEGDHFFLDEAGNPTDVVSGDAAKMKVVVYLEGNKTYPDAFVTVDATSDDQKALNDLSTELTGSGAPTSDKDGGGCDAGLGLAGLLAVIPALARRRK